MRKKAVVFCAGIAVASGLAVNSAVAAVTPYSWIRAGETGNVFLDSSGTGHNFNAAFSSGCVPGAGGGGNPAAVIMPTGVGGPLGGPAGPTSTSSTRWGFYGCANAGMWIQGPNNTVPTPDLWSLPAVNWVMEAWVLPVGTGGGGGHATSQFLSTGTGHFGGVPGGARFVTEYNPGDGTIAIRAEGIGPQAANNFQIGDSLIATTSRWVHVAVVNDNGTTTFYANGVAQGAPATGVTAPSGVPYIGSGQDTGQSFDGFLDEVRYSTFAAGAFAVTDLLLRPSGPSIVAQPQSAAVWSGGAAPFNVLVAIDADTSYQWKRDGADIPGEQGPELFLPTVAAADDGDVFTVLVNNSEGDLLSGSATLTVVPIQTENVAFYRAAVQAEASLTAYLPVDGDSDVNLANVKDPTHDGVLSTETGYDGQTNRAFGERSLRFTGNNDVTIANSADYEFGAGSGTIEALIYLAAPSSAGNGTIFSLGASPVSYYQIQAALDGSALVYKNDSGLNITWPAPVSLLGRLAHVAFVFTPGKITAYLDGISLGEKDHPSFGLTPGQGVNIGSSGRDLNGLPQEAWRGNIDELAVYTSALSANTIAIHNSRFIYGTAVTGPSIQTIPTGTKSLLAGGAPVFSVKAGGTAPLSYQWKRNGTAITGNDSATTANLVLNNSTIAMSGDYTVTISNPIGDVTSDPFTVNFTAPPDAYSAMVLGDNPSAYWRLNETAGTILKDLAGGIDGTYATTVNLGVDGAPGVPDKSAHFAGEGSPVPNAIVPYTPTLNPSTAFSLEFWVKPDQGGQISRCVIGNQNRNTGRAGYAVYQGFNVNAWEAHIGFADTVLFIQGQQPAVAGRWDHIVVTWDGVGVARIYVNGVDDTSPDSTTGGPHRPNLSVPLEIGSRFGSAIPYPGTIDEVAFYNHLLTPEEIHDHWSVSWVPSSITTQPPATLNVTEPNTAIITAVVAGYPNTYQWFKDGLPLSATTNPDGTQHYPSGVNSPTLVIDQATPLDSAIYHLEVTNPLNDSITTDVNLTVAPDTTPPTIGYVTADASLTRVRVHYSRWVTPETANIAANYTFSGGVTANSVALVPSDPSVVDVVTTGLTPGSTYTVSVSGVLDQRANHNLIGPNSTSFTAYVLTPGVLAWDYYARIPGTAVDTLTSDAQWPDGVYTNGILTNFSTLPLTSGDLNVNPGFGPRNLGSDYGIRVYGWVTPSVAGAYRFFLRSDDASQLFVSTSEDAAGKEPVAFEVGCCDPFKEPPAEETSEPRNLLAGQSYYIEVLNKEGGGGDYVEVAWRLEGDPTAAANLTPIGAAFISGYGPRLAPRFNAIQRNGAELTITWSGIGTLQESTDLKTWTPVAGNPPSGYTVTPTANSAKFYRIQQ